MAKVERVKTKMEVLPLQNQYPYMECFNTASTAPSTHINGAASAAVVTSQNDDVKGRQNIHKRDSGHVHHITSHHIRSHQIIFDLL